MIVRFSPTAADDLLALQRYFEEIASPHGESMLRRLVTGCEKLASMPDRGLLHHGRSGRSFRRILIGRHIVLYDVRGDVLNILRVVHAHRDLRDIFRLDEG